VAAVPCASCKHGFPQAFFSDPTQSRNLHSATLRLTCPWLVQHIDLYEAEDGVRKFNEILRGDSELGRQMQDSIKEANGVHRAIRARFFSEPEGRAKLERFRKEERESKKGIKFVDAIMASGFIGVSEKNVDDVKCLHAHTADFLLRGRNAVGEETLRRLGVDPAGGDDCWQQCDYRVPMDDNSWQYRSIKNKSKLKLRKANRTRLRGLRRRTEEPPVPESMTRHAGSESSEPSQ